MGARVRSLTIGVAIGSAFAVAGVCGTGAYLYSQHHYQELLDAARDSALARAELIRAALEHGMIRQDRTLIAPMVQAFGSEPGVAREECGQVLVECGIDETVDAALGDPRQGGEGDGQEIELEGERLAVKVAAGENFGVEDQRIVRSGIQFDFEDTPRFGERIADGAVDLRGAAQ